MKYLFDSRCAGNFSYRLDAFRFDAENTEEPAEGIVATFEWHELNALAQSMGHEVFEGQEDVVDYIEASIHWEMPFLKGQRSDSVVDDEGEQWIYPLPAYERITESFIEI